MKFPIKLMIAVTCLHFYDYAKADDSPEKRRPIEVKIDGTKQTYLDHFDQAVSLGFISKDSPWEIPAASAYKTDHFRWWFDCKDLSGEPNCLANMKFLSQGTFAKAGTGAGPEEDFLREWGRDFFFEISGRNVDRDYMIILTQKFDIQYSHHSFVIPSAYFGLNCDTKPFTVGGGGSLALDSHSADFFDFQPDQMVRIIRTIKKHECPLNQFFVSFTPASVERITFKEFEITILEEGPVL